MELSSADSVRLLRISVERDGAISLLYVSAAAVSTYVVDGVGTFGVSFLIRNDIILSSSTSILTERNPSFSPLFSARILCGASPSIFWENS